MKRIFSIIILISLCKLSFSQTCWDEISFTCKVFDTPFTDSISIDLKNVSYQLDKESWIDLGLNEIEKFNNEYSYFIEGKVSNNNFDLYVVVRQFDEETIHWTCVIDKKGKLTDWEITAYGNSEGFLKTYSNIFKNRIQIMEFNEFASPKQNDTLIYLSKAGFKKEMPVPNKPQ